jgi:hypothetical protein
MGAHHRLPARVLMDSDITSPSPYRVRKRRRRQHRRHARRRILLGLLLIFLIALGVAVWTALPAARATQDARRQIRALQAEKATLSHMPSSAELATLEGHVHQLASDMQTIDSAWGIWKGPALLVSQVSPSLHAQVQQVDTLVPLGVQITRASDRLLQVFTPIVAQTGTSLDSSTLATLAARLASQRATLQSLARQFAEADTLRQQIDESAVPGALQSGMQLIDTYLPAAPAAMRALAAAPEALGIDGPRTYLLVPQNPEDLRASGGFIGTVVLLRAENGHVHLIRSQSSDRVENGVRPNVIPPLPLALHAWGAWFFRDANWSADYPTSAQLLALFYTLAMRQHLDGVIAITPEMLRTVFALTGPVTVPGIPTPLTADNAFRIIDEGVNLPGRIDKSFAVKVYKAVFDRLLTGPHTIDSAVLRSVRQNVLAHDLQIFSYDPEVESAIRATHADGAINPTTGDYLYVVDTNVNQNKINQFIQEHISYSAAVQPDHTILATTTIQYRNDAMLQLMAQKYGGTQYQDFVRVFVPEGSTLVSASGFDQQWPTFTVHHKTQFSGFFAVPSLQTHTVTLQYRIPATAAPQETYSLYVQRQAGTGAIPFDATISGIWLASGQATLHTTLTRDVTLSAPLLGGLGVRPPSPPPPDPLLTPGSHPEPWVSVPTGLVPMPPLQAP